MGYYKIKTEANGSSKSNVMVQFTIGEIVEPTITNMYGVAVFETEDPQIAWEAAMIDDDWEAIGDNPAEMDNQTTVHTFNLQPA